MNSLRVFKTFNAVFQFTDLYILIWLSSLANPQFFDVLLKKKKASKKSLSQLNHLLLKEIMCFKNYHEIYIKSYDKLNLTRFLKFIYTGLHLC